MEPHKDTTPANNPASLEPAAETHHDTYVWPKVIKKENAAEKPLEATSSYSAPLPLPENPYAATSLDIEPEKPTGKSYAVTWLLAWLLPGIELIYLGYVARGIIKFITLGGLGIWTIASLIYLFIGKTTSKDGRALINRRKYLALSLILTLLVAGLQITAGVALSGTAITFSSQLLSSADPELETNSTTVNAAVANTPKDAAIAEKATTVQKIAETYAVSTPETAMTYPTMLSQFSTTDIPLPTNTTLSGVDPTAENGDTTIGYKYVKGRYGADGGKVSYWDYSKDALAEPLYVGAISSNSTFTTPAN